MIIKLILNKNLTIINPEIIETPTDDFVQEEIVTKNGIKKMLFTCSYMWVFKIEQEIKRVNKTIHIELCDNDGKTYRIITLFNVKYSKQGVYSCFLSRDWEDIYKQEDSLVSFGF